MRALRWIVLIAVLAGGAAYVIWQPFGAGPTPRPPQGILALWAPQGEAWSARIQASVPPAGGEAQPRPAPDVVRLPGTVALAPGAYAVELERSLGTAREHVTQNVRIEDGGYHLLDPRLRPLRLALEGAGDAGKSAGRSAPRNAVVLAGGALWLDGAGKVLHLGGERPLDARLVDAEALHKAPRLLDLHPVHVGLTAASGPWLVVGNPYGEALDCKLAWMVASRPHVVALRVPAAGAFAIRVPADRAVSVSSSHPDGTLIEHREARVAKGATLYTIGGATLYAWHGPAGDWTLDGQRVLPTSLLPLPLAGTLRLRGVYPEEVDPGDPSLLRIGNDKPGDLGLLARASAPALAPKTGPLREMTRHPDLQIAELALPAALAGKTVRQVAVRGETLVGLVEGAVHDLGDGKVLHEPGPKLASVSVTADGLFLITRDGHAATIRDGAVVVGQSLADPTLEPWSAADGKAVVLLGGLARHMPLIFHGEKVRPLLPNGGDFRDKMRPAADVPERYTAIGLAPGRGLLVARERQIDLYALGRSGAIVGFSSILQLPPGPDVIGLLDLGTAVLLSTKDTVYVYSDGTVMPLVDGIGGPLYAWKDGVLIHDLHSHRLLVLSGAPVARTKK